jgi:hypothetical protein
VYRLARTDYLKLIPILALAFYMSFIPHLNYPYPLHLDEWTHLACSNEIIKEARAIGLSDPFSGEARNLNQFLEVSFHLFWAVFYQISGISWLTIFRYFPSFVFMVTVLSVYILGNREGFGWEAAFFTCLIPTTVGILGPAFMVPVALGLIFIPLSMFIAFNLRGWWAYAMLFGFAAFLLSLHAATVVGLVIILIPYILLNVKNNFKHSLGITLALATPFLAAIPLLLSRGMLPTSGSLLTPQYPYPYVDLPPIIATYGYLPIVICLFGVFLLAIKGGTKNYGLVLGFLFLLVMLATFFALHYGIPILYYRGLVYAMLILSIVAGAGLMGVKNLRLPIQASSRLRVPLIMQNMGKISCLILIGLTLFFALPERHAIGYYHMIDQADYEAFVWIKDNVEGNYDKAILDPWKASAFTAITGKKIYSRIAEFPKATDNEAYAFLGNNCTDTDFMKSNGISIVYTRGGCDNPSLMRVREHVYLLTDTRPQSTK